jgi:hypothetical protein
VADDAALRWGIDFLTTSACRDAKAGSGLKGFGSSFEYTDPRQGTLMSALAIAAQIVRVACLDPIGPEGDFSFYCGTLTALFGPEAGAMRDDRLKFRDCVKKVAAASRDERKALVRSVVAQFESCGRQDDLRHLGALLYEGVNEYERMRGQFDLAKCRAKCDPTSKQDWGLGARYVAAKKQMVYPSTGACFPACSPELAEAPALVKFIHRRVLQGITPDEMRDLAGLLAPAKAAPKAEVYEPRTDLYWIRCAVGQNWDGAACTGTAKVADWTTALAACPAGYRLPTDKEFRNVMDCVEAPGAEGGDATACNTCASSATCTRLFGADVQQYWSRSFDGLFRYPGTVSLGKGRVVQLSSWHGGGGTSAAIRCVRWVPEEARASLVSEPPLRKGRAK